MCTHSRSYGTYLSLSPSGCCPQGCTSLSDQAAANKAARGLTRSPALVLMDSTFAVLASSNTFAVLASSVGASPPQQLKTTPLRRCSLASLFLLLPLPFPRRASAVNCHYIAIVITHICICVPYREPHFHIVKLRSTLQILNKRGRVFKNTLHIARGTPTRAFWESVG